MNKLSPVDERLAALGTIRALAAIRASETMARQVGAFVELQLGKMISLQARDSFRAGLLADELPKGVALILQAGFEDIAADQHRRSVSDLVRAIPFQWWRAVITLPEGRRGEPVRKRMTVKQKQEFVTRTVFPPLDKERIKQIVQMPAPDGMNWRQRIAKLTSLASPTRISREIISGLAQGENVQQLKKRLMPLLGNVSTSAQRVARTEARRVAEMAQRDTWDALGDMMIGAQILAVMDSRTRPEHAFRNGRIYYKDGEPSLADMPHLPDAPNCRCYSVPVLAPPEEMDTDELRATFRNIDGEVVPDPEVYTQWFQNAPLADRRAVVGIRRYEAMRRKLKGIRSPDWTDFLSNEGNLLTLNQVRHTTWAAHEARKAEVERIIRLRKAAIQQVAHLGFLLGRLN